MSALRRIGALVSGCALVLAAQACNSAGSSGGAGARPATTAPSAAASAPTTGPASAAPQETGVPLRRDRQVVFATVASDGKKMLTVSSTGALALTEEYSDRALFVAVPVEVGGDTFRLHTGKLRSGGESWCLRVTSGGQGNPLLLKTAGCDAGDRDQLFTFPAAADGNGRLMEVAGLYVHQWGDTDKIVAEESGEGDDLTAFTVTDRGEATLPSLGD